MKDSVTPYQRHYKTDQMLVYQEEEISLIDLLSVLIKQKKIIIGTTLLFVIAGLFWALTKPVNVEFVSVIEVGKLIKNGDNALMPIEPIDSILVKLNQGYIPSIINGLIEAGELKTLPHVIAESDKDSGMILLKSTGSKHAGADHKEMHNRIVAALLADHQRIYEIVRDDLNDKMLNEKIKLEDLKSPSTQALKQKKIEKELTDARIAQNEFSDIKVYGVKEQALKDELKIAQLKMEEYEDPRIFGVQQKEIEARIINAEQKVLEITDSAKVLDMQSQSIEELKNLLVNQIKELDQNIENSNRHRQQAVGNTVNGDNAMAVLLIDEQIQDDRNRRAQLEERLYINLPEQHARLEKAIEDNHREQEAQRMVIGELKGQLDKLLVDREHLRARQAMVIKGQEAQLVKFDMDRQHNVEKFEPVVTMLEVQQKKSLEDGDRGIRIQEQLVNRINSQIDNLFETKALTTATRSNSPVGMSGRMILVLATVLGLMLGVFAAFIAELYQKARTRILVDPVPVMPDDQAVELPSRTKTYVKDLLDNVRATPSDTQISEIPLNQTIR